MRKRLVCLILIAGVLTSCSMGNTKESQKVGSNKPKTESGFKENNEPKNESNLNDNDDVNAGTNKDENKVDEQNTSSYAEEEEEEEEEENSDISDEVKNYILNGQGDKIEVDKLKWSERFLEQLDVSSLYEKYIGEGGDTKSVSNFAKYITLNAPIRNDWEELFRTDLYNIYKEEVVKIEHLEGDLYRAYVYKDGQEVPFVTVSSRTGYFHG